MNDEMFLEKAETAEILCALAQEILDDIQEGPDSAEWIRGRLRCLSGLVTALKVVLRETEI